MFARLSYVQQAFRALPWSAVLACAALLAGPAPARAAWPMDRPVTIVVPQPAGTGNDVLARLLAEALHRKLGATVIVENRSGASGNIGQNFVARAAPDGYTFLITSPGSGANNLLIFKSLPFNPLTDFTYVMQLCEQTLLLVSRPGYGPKTVGELVAKMNADPAHPPQTAIPGIGAYGHLAALAFQDVVGKPLNIVPYRAGPQIVPDLLSGTIDLSFDLSTSYLPLIRDKQLIALAVIGDSRSDDFPGVPTLKEAGVNFSAAPWYGLEGPKGIPADIVARMNAAVTDILTNDAGVRDKLKIAALNPKPTNPAAFEATVHEEVEKWRPIITKYHLTND